MSRVPQQLTLFGVDAQHEARDSGRTRLIQLGARIVEFRFARTRRRTIGISVDAEGLAVVAPHYAAWVEIEGFLREKTRWILARLEEWAGAGRPVRIVGAHGETLPFWGEPIALEVYAGSRHVALADGRLAIRVREPHRRERVRAELIGWLKTRALERLAPRAAHYAALIGRAAPRVAVSSARTRWGVCAADGRIRLSWRLVHVAPALADYVVAHEVAHLVEMNHSARFWRLVESLYPDYREARQRLDLSAAALPLL